MKPLKSVFARIAAAVAEQKDDVEFSRHFTPRAREMFALAEDEATGLNHNFIGTEHVLLGLLKLDRGVAAKVLRRQGVDLTKVRNAMEPYVRRGPDVKMLKPIPFTPRVKTVLVTAHKEARALNHTYVGTEHILLGLLRDDDGIAKRALEGLGLSVTVAQQEILKELDPNLDNGRQPSQLSSVTMDISNLHLEGARIVRVIEDGDRHSLAFEVSYAMPAGGSEFPRRRITFSLCSRYLVDEGHGASGESTIQSAEIIPTDVHLATIRMRTDHGLREVTCWRSILEENL